MTSPLLVENHGHVQTWTLNLPDQRNPVTGPDMVDAIVAAVAQARADISVRAIVITGSGSAFSAGGNIKDIQQRSGMFGGNPVELQESYRRGVQRIPLALQACEVPIIAAVNGPAVGAGCDLAMMADLRIASTGAFFAESFVKLGLISGDGGAWLLQQAIGPARAAEMTLTGDRVDAQTALTWGLVSQVVSPEELLTTALTLGERIAVNPPRAVRAAKTLLRESRRMDLAATLEMSAAMQSIAHHTDDHITAISPDNHTFQGR
jgi:enoyl-CoA hydratase/carnithine racemase